MAKKASAAPVKIAIFVSGGVVQSVYASREDVEVELVDRDILYDEKCQSSAQIADAWKKATLACPFEVL